MREGVSMKTKYIVYLVLACIYGIYYFGVSEGFIKKNVHEGEMTAIQAAINLVTPKSPREKLTSISEEFFAEMDKLKGFEEFKENVESGQIT
jgi:hypothetical protein